MKLLGKITYESGWNGGRYILHSSPIKSEELMDEIKNIPIKNLRLKVLGKMYPATYDTEYGFDSDMGHQYHWEMRHLCCVIDVPIIGVDHLSVKDIFEKTKIRNIELYEVEDNER